MRRRTTRLIAVLGAATAAALLTASSASATFHLMQIRELYLGDNADTRTEYVELQMWAPFQSFVMGHSLTYYNSAGALIATQTFPGNLPNSNNQQTILAATPLAVTQFGKSSDLLTTDLDRLDNTGGAVCWDTVDCVAYGTFNDIGAPLPSNPGTPVAVPASGSALVRTIARGCATALDPADDTNVSSADFSSASPNPRNNASPITETPCSGPGGGGSGAPPPSGTPAPKKKKCKKAKKRAFAAKKCKKKRRS